MSSTMRRFCAKKGRLSRWSRDAYSDDERPAGLAKERVSGSFFHLIA